MQFVHLFNTTVTPRIAHFDDKNITLVEGGNLSLECSASGDPTPDITWEVPSYTET